MKIRIRVRKEEVCPVCGTVHDYRFPHDRHSLKYIIGFFVKNGRFPKWKDAMAHCSKEMQEFWRDGMIERGVRKEEFE